MSPLGSRGVPRDRSLDTRVAVLINPIAGAGRRPETSDTRASTASAWLRARRLDGDVHVSQGPGHLHDLARGAVESGAAVVVAWGGDGTINEVASALAFGTTALGIVPAGSGNGLARALHIPFESHWALDIAATGTEVAMDAGEFDGRLFFNVAGLGLDARVAHRFAQEGLAERGFVKYIGIAARELIRSKPDTLRIAADGTESEVRALLVALANARQYGNGAIIAPSARIDDGRLDLVVVRHRPAWLALVQAPALFAGQVARLPGVTLSTCSTVSFTGGDPLVYHVDGEPRIGGTTVTARVRPRALRVRVAGSRQSAVGSSGRGGSSDPPGKTDRPRVARSRDRGVGGGPE
jgi:YegS/Rv2252/BmrU family lipid kinase